MSVAAPERLAEGQTIADRYVIARFLGEGGMGDVYEVEHELLGRRFALKRLAPDRSTSRDAVERFLREARIAAATGHDAVVDVVDLGFADDGWPYLVMELLVGETLRERLRREPLSIAETRSVGDQLLDALVAVHERGVVHRDIKPDNLFLIDAPDAALHLKILDFGVAGLSRDPTASLLTDTGTVLGTPLYMAPEQMRGESVDPRADLYACAAVLYECVADAPPFSADSHTKLVALALETDPDPAPLAAAPAPLRDAILRGLAKAPRDRFRDAAAMRAALRGERTPSIARTRPDGPAARRATEPDARMVVGDATTVSSAAAAHAEPSPAPRGRARALARLASAAAVAAIVAVAVLLASGREHRRPLTVELGAGVPGDAGMRAPTGEASVRRALLEAGRIERLRQELERAVLRHPLDVDLRAELALVSLVDERERAKEIAAALAKEELTPRNHAIVTGATDFESGDHTAAIDELDAVIADHPDDLALLFLRAHMLRYADRFDEARRDYLAILERWPRFAPAVDGLLQRLIWRDELDEARSVVEGYVAAAPDDTRLELLLVELAIGERRYREALAQLERLARDSPAREDEFYQFIGDLRLLTWDMDGAILAYENLGEGVKRDHYVAGALLHGHRRAEAAALLLAAIERLAFEGPSSRLAKLTVDASLLALEEDDVEAARAVAAALADVPPGVIRFDGASHFARQVIARLAGEPLDAASYPLGEASPYHVLLSSWGEDAREARAALDAALEPGALRFHTVVTHVYPALRVEAARAAAAAGDHRAVLAITERVLRPRHYDTSRGVVLPRALSLRAASLEALGRDGEARALRRRLADRF